MNSPVTSATYYGELSHRNIPFVSQLKTAVNYYRFLFCVSDKDKKKMIPKVSGKWFCVKPLGYLMHLRDKMITKA